MKRLLLLKIAFLCFAVPPLINAANRVVPDFKVPIEGAKIFRDYCATCHGSDLKGKGPSSPSLRKPVPDLTDIEKQNGGIFPTERVKRTIEGAPSAQSAHGSREMPIWGPIFHRVEWDADLGEVRLQNVTNYVRSMQKK